MIRMDKKYRAMMEQAHKEGGLLDGLLAAETVDGYVTEEAMYEAAEVFGMTPAAVYDAASFYGMLNLSPKCAHEVRVCRGGSCHVDGAEQIRTALEEYLGISMGESTPGRSCKLDYMACQGQCGEGPVVMIDGEMYLKQTAEQVIETLKKGGIR